MPVVKVNNQNQPTPDNGNKGGKSPKNKKPFYKKWWFWVLVVIVVAGIGGGAGSDGESSKSETSSSSVKQSESTSVSSSESGSSEASSSQESSSEVTAEGDTAFDVQDVSDAKIESIKTYGDYLNMHEAIINYYYAQYESALQGTAMYDDATFQATKEKYDAEFDKQEKLYGALKNNKLVGRSTLVDSLKSLRDSLNESVENLKQSIQ